MGDEFITMDKASANSDGCGRNSTCGLNIGGSITDHDHLFTRKCFAPSVARHVESQNAEADRDQETHSHMRRQKTMMDHTLPFQV